jgi:hypothetical protein
VFIAIIIFPLLGGMLIAEIGVFASTHAKTVRQAYQRMAIPLVLIVMIPSMLFLLLPQHIISQLYSPTFAQEQLGMPLLVIFAALFVLDMLVLMAVFKRFGRSQLIADS